MNDLDMKRAELEAYMATGGYVIDFLMLQIVLLEQRVKELESEKSSTTPNGPNLASHMLISG